MSHYTLDQFFADTRATIRSKGIPSGLAEIRDHLGDPVPYTVRTTIGHDPETDVHVLVHGREKAGSSAIHDHGPCWVIYGNYKNATRMRRWRRLDAGSDDTFFIRVTGGDVETRKTLKFDAERKTVEVADRALGQR